jgi:tetratricopeptide (TPR) repeat protein
MDDPAVRAVWLVVLFFVATGCFQPSAAGRGGRGPEPDGGADARARPAAGAALAVLLLLAALAHLGAEPVSGHRLAVHHFNLAEAFAARGHEDRAEVEYRRALQAEPTHTRSLTGLGNTLVSRGEVAEALALYEDSARA